MLSAMNEDRSFFGDASPDAVCAFNLFGPYAAKPDAPLLEVVGPAFIASMMDCHAVTVAQQNDIPLLPDDRVETVDFLSRLHDDIRDGLFRGVEFVLGDNVGRRPAFWVEAVINQAPVP